MRRSGGRSASTPRATSGSRTSPSRPRPATGEVVVRVATCGICGTDLHEYVAGPIVTPVEPHPLTGAQNPQILGHEFAGDVVAVGPGVTRVAEGDRVAIMPLAYCGRCALLPARAAAPVRDDGLRRALPRLGRDGASSPRSPSTRSCALPDGVTLPARRADRADGGRRVRRRASRRRARATACSSPAPGRSARSLRSARAPPARPTVYVSEPNPARRARAEALGVATVLDPTSVDVPGALSASETDGLGVDVAIECSGHPSGFTAAIRSLRRRGTLAQTGLFVGEASVEPMLWALNDLTIVGTWCYWVYDFDRIAAQIAAGDLPVERVVTSNVDAGRGAGRVRAARVGQRRTRSRC